MSDVLDTFGIAIMSLYVFCAIISAVYFPLEKLWKFTSTRLQRSRTTEAGPRQAD